MADKVFAETKGMKKINLKAIICFMLAFVMTLMPFADVTDIEVVANAGSEPTIEIVKDSNKAYLYFKNCEGMTGADFSLNMDSSVVESVKITDGKDSIKMRSTKFKNKNYPDTVYLANNPEDIICAVFFLESLWSSEKFEAEAKGCGINGEYFHFATMTMNLKKGYTASDVKISASGSVDFEDGKSGVNFVVKEYNEQPEAIAPSTEVPTTSVPATTEPSTQKPSDNKPAVEIVMKGNTAHFYLKNCTGLTTADFSVKLNSSVVSSVNKGTGKDFSKMQKYSSELSNFAMIAVNTSDLSDIVYSLVFADELYSSEMFNDKAEGCGINGEYFHFATLTMELEEGYTASDIKISAKGTATFGTNKQKDIRCIVSGNEAATDNTAHSHKYASKSSNKDDCTKAGTKTFTCACGDSYSEKIPARAEHKLSWRVVKNATSFKEGKKEAKCKNCDYKETSAIEKLPEIAVKSEKKNEIKLSGKDKLLSISGTRVRDMIDAVPENTVIRTADGKEAEKDTLIATGMKIVMKDNKGKAIDTRVVIVPGDVDCDGIVTAADARNALRKSVELESLDIYQTAAADIQQDKNVGADDARTILRNSVGLEKTEEIFKNIS